MQGYVHSIVTVVRVSRFGLAFLLLVGCSGMPDTDPALQARMTEMFRAIYTETDAVHIDPLNRRDFTLAGLDGMRNVKPSAHLYHEDDRVALVVDGDTVAEADLPDDDDDTEDWSEFARDMVLRVQAHHPSGGEFSDEEEYYEAFIDSALMTLDRFSRYANPRDAAEFRAEREGFGGIGVELEIHPEGARIDAVLTDKPADRAGLRVGDRIVTIDTIRIAGDSLRNVLERLRGPIGSVVNLQIARDGEQNPVSVTVTRGHIVPNTVYYTEVGNHALIRISSFNELTARRLDEAIQRARTSLGHGLAGIIMDLRGNLGGLLDQSVNAADLFLEQGLISAADGRHRDSHQRFEATPADIAADVPLIVLINGTTASAAEILAAALQDHGRAVIIGMNSFGKGSIQTVVAMPNGGELYLTWARFVAPSGYPLERLGVMPTICTSGASDAVAVLDTALGYGPDSGWELLHKRRKVDINDQDAVRDYQKLCPWQPHVSGDIDMGIAELLLDSPALFQRALDIARMDTGA